MKYLTIFILIFSISACSVTVKEDMIASPSKDINSQNLKTLSKVYSTVELTAKDGSKLFALQKYNSDIKTTLVVFHGNALNLTLQPWFGVLNTLSELNINILAIDYRGYGESEGKASFTHMKEDAQSTLNIVSSDQNVYVYGLSLGSVMAAEVMTDKRVKGVIIEGGITNQNEMIDLFKSKKTFGSLFNVELDKSLNFDIPKSIQSHQIPLLVIHGNQDDNIPVSMGETIFTASNHSNSRLFLVDNGGHCDTFAVDKDEYLERLNTFIN